MRYLLLNLKKNTQKTKTDLSDKNTSNTVEELPRWGSGKESACQYKRHKRHGLDHWVGKWQPTPVFLSGQSHGQSSLVCYRPWGHREGHDEDTSVK